MKLAVLSDIHGNYRAFERCVEYARERGIDTFVFLGDYLGEFAYPQKTMQMLYQMREKYQCFFVRGNKEDYWLNRRANVNCDWKDGNSSVYSMNYNFANLTEEDLDFFETLPIFQELHFDGLPSIMLCHGTPENNRVKFIPETENFGEIVDNCTCDYILCGHSHVQRTVSHNGKQVLNPGAVGVPLHSENGRTQFMILQSHETGWSHEFVSLDYEKEEVIRDLKESGLYEKSSHWCQITELSVRTGEVAHGQVLGRAMELCAADEGDYKWYEIPERYWEQAIKELFG